MCKFNIWISRILKRDPFRKEEEIKSIFKKQWSQKKKIQMGQNIIQNEQRILDALQKDLGKNDFEVTI